MLYSGHICWHVTLGENEKVSFPSKQPADTFGNKDAGFACVFHKMAATLILWLWHNTLCLIIKRFPDLSVCSQTLIPICLI